MRSGIRILFACEGGIGRGHVAGCRIVAEALGPGFAYQAGFYRDDFADELSAFCDHVFVGPGLIYDRSYRESRGNPATATWGEFLGDLGFRDPAMLTDYISYWQATLRETQTDLLVCKKAPCALLAARAMELPVVSVDTAYETPADGLAEFPVFMPEFSERIHDEAAILATVNRAAVPLGLKPLSHLPEICDCDVKLVRGMPFADPYAAWRTEPLLPPAVVPVDLPSSAGEEIFVYLSHAAGDPPALFEALGAVARQSAPAAPVRLYAPLLADELKAELAAQGVLIEERPVAPREIARRSRLMVHYGQPGTLAIGLSAGLAQVALPQQLEQHYHASKVAERGAMRILPRHQMSCDTIIEAIRMAYEDRAMAASAAALGDEIKPLLATDSHASIRERLRPILVEIVRRKGLA